MTGSRSSATRSPLVRSATPGASSSAGSASPIDASAASTQSVTESGRRSKALSRARCMRAVMVPRACASGPKSPPAASGRPPAAKRSRSEVRASAQPPERPCHRLLHHPQITPLPGPADQRRRHVVEAGRVEGDQQVDRRPGTVPEPWVDGEVAAIAAVEDGDLLVVAHVGHRARPGSHAPDRGQHQRGQLGVAQGVDAHGQPVLVLEEPQRRLVPGPQEARLVAHPAEADDHVGQATVHLGHHVEQPGPAGPQHLHPAQRDLVGAAARGHRPAGAARATPRPTGARPVPARRSFRRPALPHAPGRTTRSRRAAG